MIYYISFRNHRYSIRGFGSKNDSEIIFDTSFDKLDVLEQLERVNRDGTHTHSALQTALKSGIHRPGNRIERISL